MCHKIQEILGLSYVYFNLKRVTRKKYLFLDIIFVAALLFNFHWYVYNVDIVMNIINLIIL